MNDNRTDANVAIFPPQSDNIGTQPPKLDVYSSIQEINEAVQKSSAWLIPFKQQMAKAVVGQDQLVERLLIGLLTGGHVLLEGLPGLAKTLAVKTLAMAVQ